MNSGSMTPDLIKPNLTSTDIRSFLLRHGALCLLLGLCSVPQISKAADAVSALGRLEPENGVIRLAAPPTSDSISGAVVAELLVGLGDDVEAGQLLAVMETRALAEAQLVEAEAAHQLALRRVDAARGSADETCVRARVADRESERRVELLRKGVAGEEEAELATGRAEALAAACEAAKTTVVAAQAEVAVAIAHAEIRRLLVQRSEVHAPSAGRILDIHAWPGELASINGLLEIGQVENMYAIAEIYETDITRVRVGQKATVSSDALSESLTGTVEKIRPKVAKLDAIGTDPSARKDARIVEVEIRLDDSARVSSLTYLQVDVVISP
jgi:HlyD family secretion protein